MKKSDWIKLMGEEWTLFLQDLLRSDYMTKVMAFISVQYTIGKIHPPERNLIFNAFKLCPINNLKVVIVGDDPALNWGANGLCYASSFITATHNQSVHQIRTRIEYDFYNGLCVDFDYSFENWAKQGVLMLPRALTAQSRVEGSHYKQWSYFTQSVIEKISEKGKTIFIFMGEEISERFSPFVKSGNCIMNVPNPRNANLLYNWKSDCFIRTNQILERNEKGIIKW